MLDVLRAIVAETLRALGRAGLVVGAAGGVSVAERASGVVLVTGAGLAADEAHANAVAEVALADGRVIAGPAPTEDLALHLALLAAGHGAVVVAGAPHAAALALVRDEIPVVRDDQQARCGGPTRVLGRHDDPATRHAAVVDALVDGRRTVALRHGPLVAVGGDVATALAAALAADDAARVYLLAARIAPPPTL